MFDECRHFLVIVFPFREDEINVKPFHYFCIFLCIILQTLFPNVIDFEDDVFALVERKESMEKFLREIVMTMDFLVYRPLFYFLNPHDEFRPVERKVTCIQSTVRMHFTKKKMIQVSRITANARMHKNKMHWWYISCLAIGRQVCRRSEAYYRPACSWLEGPYLDHWWRRISDSRE